MDERSADRWYLAIVATHCDGRAYTTVMCTRDVDRLVAHLKAGPPSPVVSRCLAHPVRCSTGPPVRLLEGDTFVDSESEDSGPEDEAMVKEDIARQYAEVQQIQILQQQQLPAPVLPPPPAPPLHRSLEQGEPRDPVFRRAMSLFSRESPRKAYPQSVLPGAPNDWVERTNSSIDLEVSLAVARSVRTGLATPTDTSRRFDHMRKSLADESRARNPRQPLWVQGLDQLRRKQETLRKKRKTNEEGGGTGNPDDATESRQGPQSRPLPQHIALLRLRRSQNGHVSSLAMAELEDEDDIAAPRRKRARDVLRQRDLVFAAGPYVSYEKVRAAGAAVSKVRGLALRVAEATELATRAHVKIINLDIARVLAGNELFVYQGTVWSGVPKEAATRLLKNEEEG